MPNNPYYHLLTLRRPELTPYVSKKQKSYFLLPIPCAAKNTEKLILNGHTYTLKKHHISIYQKYTKESPLLSPIHYTGEYCAEDQGIIKIHVYFDKRNNFLCIKIKHKDAEKKKLTCSPTDEINIRKHIEPHTNEKLNNLSKELINKKRENKIKKSKFLQRLEQESLKSMTTPTYIALLAETIDFLEDHARLEFYPNDKEISFLKKHSLRLQEKMLPKQTKRNNRAQLPKGKSLPTQPMKEIASPPTHESKEKTSNAFLADGKEPKEKQLTSSQQLEIKESNLYQQLDRCSPEGLNEMLKIIRQIDELAHERCQVLIQACIDGDIEVVKRNFRKIDVDNPDTIDLIAALLPTCVYHNHPSLFEYLYIQIKSRYIKLFLFAKPYVTLNPKKYPDTLCLSMPSVAYTTKNLEFFKLLLNEYGYNPNCSFLYFDSLLIKMASDPGAIEYMQALLQAGADPDILENITTLNAFTCSDHHKEKITPESKLAYYIKPIDRTPLHQAVWSRNIVAIQLLLQYKAKSSLLNLDKLTPFGVAFIDIETPLNEEIILIFLQLGHHIDERQTDLSVTGLYNACKNNNLAAVQLFLKFNANPCAEHPLFLLINHTPIVIRTTPLLVAVTNGYYQIVEKLLQCQISREELAYTCQQCNQHSNPAIKLLRQTYLKVCQNEADDTQKKAIKAHKEQKFAIADKLFNTADELYLEALKATKNTEDKHLILYNMALCRDKAGKQNTAQAALTQCIAIRQQLAKDPIKTQRLLPLIAQAQEKLDEIMETESRINAVHGKLMA